MGFGISASFVIGFEQVKVLFLLKRLVLQVFCIGGLVSGSCSLALKAILLML